MVLIYQPIRFGVRFPEKCQANFVFHTGLVYPAIMGTWYTDPRLDHQLQAAVRPLPGEVKYEDHAGSHGYLDYKQIPLPFIFKV